jgi:hypothetical protein
MPFFKTNKNIFKNLDEDELFEENWMDSDTLILPPKTEWDYSRDLIIEDVEIWEQIYYEGSGLGLYASWLPYAEFYLITKRLYLINTDSIETFYGKKSGERAFNRAVELGMPVQLKKIWVDSDKAWLF